MGFISTIFAAVITALLAWLMPHAITKYNSKKRLHKRNNIDNYFNFIGNFQHIDHMIYQLGIRNKIPLVDLLYFEYLNKSISEGIIKERVTIIPSPDLSSTSQGNDDILCLQTILKKIFNRNFEKVEILKTFTLENIEPFSMHLLDSIKYIESSDFIKFINTNFTKKIKSFSDFNRYHPSDRRLLAIYVHIITAWMILIYLEKTNSLHKSFKKNLGFLLWETETDKLGTYHYYCTKYKKIEFIPVLGKTILYKKKWAKFPLPVYTEDVTITLLDSMFDTVLKLEAKDNEGKYESLMYYKVVSSILASNYDRYIPFKTSYLKGRDIVRYYEINKNKKIKLRKYSYANVFLLKELRGIYGI